jgi:hypothetical protein
MEIIDGRITGTTDGHFPQYFVVGTEAEKPTNPGIGDICRVTATGKEYTCYIVNVWALTNSPCVEEYNNHLGTTDNVMSTAVTGAGTATTNAATHSMDLVAGAGGTSTYKGAALLFSGGSTFIFNAKVQNIVKGTSFPSNEISIGLTNGIGGTAYFHYSVDSDEWSVWTTKPDGTLSERTVITDLANGDTLTINGKGSKVIYSVNGAIVATHQLYDLSTATLYPICGLSTSNSISIDFIGLKVMK